MIQISVSEKHSKNAEKCSADEQPCVVCGKPMKDAKHYIHLHCGGSHAVTAREAEDLPDNEDLGSYPIGACCLRKHPELKPYALDCAQPNRPDANNSGLKSTRWDKDAKSWVSIYAAKEQGIDANWMVVCEKHGSILTIESLRLAKRHAAGNPCEFCEECRGEA